MNYDVTSLVGKLLVAPPAQTDEFWEKSVIYLYEENPNAIVGLALNKPSDRNFAHLAEHHGLAFSGSNNIHIGGPVNPAALVMLHTEDWICTNTMHIGDNFRISSDKGMLSRICKKDTPRQWKMFFGMCGWTRGQLEGEIQGSHPWSKKTAWLVANADEKLVFMDDPEKLWKQALDRAVEEITGSFFQIS